MGNYKGFSEIKGKFQGFSIFKVSVHFKVLLNSKEE